MKKTAYIILILVLLLAIAGCAVQSAPTAEPAEPQAAAPTQADPTAAPAAQPEPVAAKQPKGPDDVVTIGAVFFDLSNPGLVSVSIGAEYAAADHNVNIIWKACEGNLDKQIDLIRSFIQQEVDVIWIDSVDVNGVVPAVDEIIDAGIVALTAGSRVDGVKNDGNYNTIYYDYRDSYFAATVIGEMYKGQEGTIGLLVGFPGNLVSDYRQRGFEDGMKNYPNLKLAIEQGRWEAQTSLQKTEDMIRANDDLIHIHCIQDGMSYSAHRAVENSGKKIPMSSNDGDMEALELMRSGDYVFDNLVGNERLGYWNVVIASKLARGEKMARDQYLPSYKIMDDNLKQMVVNAGLNIIDGEELKIITVDEAEKLTTGYREEFKDFQPIK